MNDDIRAGLVPKTTKSKDMLTKHLTKYRFFGIIAVFFSSMFIGMAFGSLRYVFVVFCLVIFMICTAGSPSDPRKSFGGSLLDFLRFFAQKKTYYGSGNVDCADYLIKEDDKREAKKRKKEK